MCEQTLLFDVGRALQQRWILTFGGSIQFVPDIEFVSYMVSKDRPAILGFPPLVYYIHVNTFITFNWVILLSWTRSKERNPRVHGRDRAGHEAVGSYQVATRIFCPLELCSATCYPSAGHPKTIRIKTSISIFFLIPSTIRATTLRPSMNGSRSARHDTIQPSRFDTTYNKTSQKSNA